MRMYQLAWQNVKGSLCSYFSLILSLTFTIMIFFNFQMIVYSDALDAIGKHNQDYSSMIVHTLSVVLVFFMIFFTGYAASVFLVRRKKEMGIYIFMGLTNEKIARLYAAEMTFTGIVTLAAGIASGMLTTQLFQMILLALSDIAAETGFSYSIQPVLITSAVFLAVYLFFVIMGYFNIVRSSVLNLVSAARQNEYVRQGSLVLVLKTIAGIGILSAGFYLAVVEGGMEVLNHSLQAVVLVIAGVYFLFGGLIPLVFQGLARNKIYLYKKQRTLWVNQMIFRMKKNYRTYAAVCVLMICSVTALAASFALKERYERMVHYRNTYTFQMLSERPDLSDEAEQAVTQDNEIVYSSRISLLQVQDRGQDAQNETSGGKACALICYSQLKQLAKDTGLKFDIPDLKDDEIVNITHLYLMSFHTKRTGIEVEIAGKTFRQLDEINEPYLGVLQEQQNYFAVSDAVYEQMIPDGKQLYLSNYRIRDVYRYKASLKALDKLADRERGQGRYIGRVVTAPDSTSEWEWIKILYSLGVFMVMVFIMASGSILFMKLYNDAFEDRGRYDILQKIGCSYKTLRRAAAQELLAQYALPFAVMTVSSYFSVHALEKVMHTDLAEIRLASVGIILVFFLICYRISVGVYVKNAGIRKG